MSNDRHPEEQAAVRTTIVGGRPPGSGKSVGQIPRGIEVLVKKASVDPAFKALLLETRAEAAKEIGLQLDADEALLLAAIPGEQLETFIRHARVPESKKSVFLGKVAAAMLIALGAMVGCDSDMVSMGERPDEPEEPAAAATRPDESGNQSNSPSPIPTTAIAGEMADPPEETTEPDPKPTHSPTRGVRPDYPPPKLPPEQEDEATEPAADDTSDSTSTPPPGALRSASRGIRPDYPLPTPPTEDEAPADDAESNDAD